MKRTFTVETGQPDGNGDIINLDGVYIPERVPITENFDRSKTIGSAKVVREGDVLKATAEIPDHLLDTYPAIGFTVVHYHKKDEGKLFDEIKLYEVGLSDKPNTNPDIKTIREQITPKI